MNQNQFYNFHPDKISLVGSEWLNKSSSSVFFYCLLDGHPELINGFTNYPNLPSFGDYGGTVHYAYNLLNNTFWYHLTSYPFPFSLLDFSIPFQTYLDEFGISNKNIFIAIHYAVAILLKKDISMIKWIVLHTHCSVKDMIRVKTDFPNQKMIMTVRDPRAIAWSRKKRRMNAPAYATVLSDYLRLGYMKKMYGEILFVKHEEIHTDYDSIKKQLCSFLKIENHKILDKASYFNKPWDGQGETLNTVEETKGVLSTTGIKSTRPNQVFVNEDWKEGLNKFDLFIINHFVGRNLIKEFQYPHFLGGNTPYIPIRIIPRIEYMMLPSKMRNRIIKIYQFLEKVPLIPSLIQLPLHFFIFSTLINYLASDFFIFNKYFITRKLRKLLLK